VLRYLLLLVFELILFEVDIFDFLDALILDVDKNVDFPQQFQTFTNRIILSFFDLEPSPY
jgi:hypothetical protein